MSADRARMEEWPFGPFPLDLASLREKVASNIYGGFDSGGVPIVNYTSLDMPVSGLHYNPGLVALYGISLFDHYLSEGKEDDKERFFRQAGWLVSHLRRDRGIGVWEYRFDLSTFGLTAPWVSALAQGLGLSALSRAYALSPDPQYLESAKAALGTFRLSVAHGGVRREEADGSVWFEEYPSDPPSLVLNGFIYALFGLLDHHRTFADAEAKIFYNEGVATLERHLHCFDTGFWSFYSYPRRMLADLHYHRDIHIPQLLALHRHTTIPLFAETAERWERYTRSLYSALRRRLYRFPQRLVGRLERLLRTRQ